ncbi:MAG: glycosyltransferase family 9 protein [Candidatus Scalindua sp.]|jgi:ADP-heptose:LPS heptosyltransferase|nr:glycosyltransferase family 9 protein [Candidatus Scalindua sp.]MBT5304061.1 glycosyltransferase family 9 protein [Candidatus Scalindua sp.]MBT6052511.1 glycosyltransferase family 9 protein [Candidatus Scalindua sp.]MBT6562004.1 glycosyltransferase family 9 protein [Candidatus Scalindua sp.]MBT7210287.1 glycosyltransferase family 9 protein [Candidatus Scalindua sp.]
MVNKFKKILIMEAGGIGDMVMSTPALRALRERFSDSEIVLLTVPRTAQAVNIKHYANRIICFKQEAFSKGPSKPFYTQIISNSKLLWALRKERFDMMIDLEAIESWKSSLLRCIFYKCIGAKSKVGRNSDGKGFFLDVKVPDELFGKVHEVDRKLLIAKTLGAETNNTKQEFDISEEDREFMNKWLTDSGIDDKRTIVAMQPGAFVPSREWKSKGFVEIGRRLSQKYRARIIITGGNNDNVAYEINDDLKDIKPILAVGLSLGEFGALLERVHLFISNDTGPAHIADALNTPYVVLFGPENFYRYGPYDSRSNNRLVTGMKVSCSPCLKHTCRTHECMESITTDMVWEGVESLLKEMTKEKQV